VPTEIIRQAAPSPSETAPPAKSAVKPKPEPKHTEKVRKIKPAEPPAENPTSDRPKPKEKEPQPAEADPPPPAAGR
jgi:hypothetical protein